MFMRTFYKYSDNENNYKGLDSKYKNFKKLPKWLGYEPIERPMYFIFICNTLSTLGTSKSI